MIELIAGVILLSLVLYALTGGADFGGGVWDLMARGPRAEAQRKLIARAIAPIWEANHVWLILVVVLLFAALPSAFSTISIALHIPITLMLIGIVLRGSAFVFRAYGIQSDRSEARWSRVFAVSSTVTPIMLGVVAGAVASGRIRRDAETGVVATDFLSEWLAPFPFVLGLFTLALFAFLAAVYLTNETDDVDLRADFRRRGLYTAVASALLAVLCLALAREGAPVIWWGLTASTWAPLFHAATALASLGAFGALWRASYSLARLLAIVQVTLIVVGWGLAQYPFAVPPDVTFASAAAPASVLRPMLIAHATGAVVLIPSFGYLYALFKGRRASGDGESARR